MLSGAGDCIPGFANACTGCYILRQRDYDAPIQNRFRVGFLVVSALAAGLGIVQLGVGGALTTKFQGVGLDTGVGGCNFFTDKGCIASGLGTWWVGIPVIVAGGLGIVSSTIDGYGKAFVLATVCVTAVAFIASIIGIVVEYNVFVGYPKYTVCAPANQISAGTTTYNGVTVNTYSTNSLYYAYFGGATPFASDAIYMNTCINQLVSKGTKDPGSCFCTKYAGSGCGEVLFSDYFRTTQSQNQGTQTNCQSVVDYPCFIMASLLIDVVIAHLAVILFTYAMVILVTKPEEAHVAYEVGMTFAAKTPAGYPLGMPGAVPVSQMGMNLVHGPVLTQYANVPGVVTTGPVMMPPQMQMQQPQMQPGGGMPGQITPAGGPGPSPFGPSNQQQK